jgi:hypothetical protein
MSLGHEGEIHRRQAVEKPEERFGLIQTAGYIKGKEGVHGVPTENGIWNMKNINFTRLCPRGEFSGSLHLRGCFQSCTGRRNFFCIAF